MFGLSEYDGQGRNCPIEMEMKVTIMACLEKAYSQRANALAALKVDPVYNPLRRDSRFQALLQRVGLAP